MNALAIGCIGVFIYLFSVIFFDYMISVQKNKFIDFDVKTITAADYTVEFTISKNMYQYFEEHFLDKGNSMPEIMQLKLFIKDELESRLTDMPGLGYDGEEGDEQPIKIALVTFAFDNSSLIRWLRHRGKFIRNEDWYGLDSMNLFIQNRLKEDQTLLDKLQRPCSVFVTFQQEEGYQRALNYNNVVEQIQGYRHYDHFLDEEIKIA